MQVSQSTRHLEYVARLAYRQVRHVGRCRAVSVAVGWCRAVPPLGPVILFGLAAGWLTGLAFPMPRSEPVVTMVPVRLVRVPWPVELPQAAKFDPLAPILSLDPKKNPGG